MGGSESIVTGILPEGILEPLEPLMLLPEVKDPKQWCGGHVWVDTAKRFVYSTLAHQTENIWINTQLMKADEVRSFDDLLDERLKHRIGILDPRTAGSGASTWSYLREIKGEEYLKRFVGQKLALSRDQRVLAEILAKGKLALVLGLDLLLLRAVHQGRLAGGATAGAEGRRLCQRRQRPPRGSEKCAAPECDKVFVNWFLSREGQEVYCRAMHQATRRLDVDVKWLREVGVIAAKDALTSSSITSSRINPKTR